MKRCGRGPASGWRWITLQPPMGPFSPILAHETLRRLHQPGPVPFWHRGNLMNQWKIQETPSFPLARWEAQQCTIIPPKTGHLVWGTWYRPTHRPAVAVTVSRAIRRAKPSSEYSTVASLGLGERRPGSTVNSQHLKTTMSLESVGAFFTAPSLWVAVCWKHAHSRRQK
jgi:hypothetical protein